jgi:hypothetical protein
MTIVAHRAAPPGHAPRFGLAWVTWRQHRVALAGVAVLLGGLALYLLIMGLRIHSAYASLASCYQTRSAACAVAGGMFNTDYYGTAQRVTDILQVVPVLIGVFVGAPLLARELETGTFRFAWTQGCGSLRWVITKLVLLAAVVTAASFAFSALFSWYYQPFFALGNDGVLAPQLFDLRGVEFAAWTLVAFAIGAIAGVLIRRTVPAIAASLAVWTGLDLATALFLRKHYQTPVTASSLNSDPGNSWVVGQWWRGPNGHPVSGTTIRNLVQQHVGAGGTNVGGAYRWLAQHGYSQWSSYQPQARFWHFQLIEGGWLLALSLILIVATVWLVRRRAA